MAKLEAVLAALHGVDGFEVESLRAALKRAKEVKVQLVDVQIKECEGFLSRARAHLTCEADHSVRDAEQRLEALKQMQLFFPTTSSGRGSRTPPVARDCCPDEGAIGSRKASDGGGTSFQAHLQERRLRLPIAGVDCRKTGRSQRGNVGGETKRSREDQQHHVSGRTTVATRSCSWNASIHGDEQCLLRTTYMLRRSWDSDVESSSVRGPTQVDSDPEDEAPLVKVPCVSPNLLATLEQYLREEIDASQSHQVTAARADLGVSGPVVGRYVESLGNQSSSRTNSER